MSLSSLAYKSNWKSKSLCVPKDLVNRLTDKFLWVLERFLTILREGPTTFPKIKNPPRSQGVCRWYQNASFKATI